MPDAVAQDVSLSELVGTLTGISDHLLASYAQLAARAERVEKDLVRANQDLATKVAELDAANSRLEAILHALPTGVVVRDAEGRIVRVNSAACVILDASPATLIGRTSHPHSGSDPHAANSANARTDGAAREVRTNDGRRLVLATRHSQIESRAGERVGSVEILDDRTQLCELNERLASQSKMVALGNMAAGIAHEIRNPMNAIGGFADLLRREFEPGTRTHRFATRICDGVADADAIIASMLSFASPERLHLERIDPAELVSSGIRAARESLPEGADAQRWTITSEVAAAPFRGDRIKLRQALRNLVANALQAQEDGGRVHVEVRATPAEVVVRVIDAGPGIPLALRTRVSEPFFTTRAAGTGLGLALVHTIAELHGGRFEVSEQPSCFGGAEVALRFPFNPA